MRHFIPIFALVCGLLAAGCRYEVPVVTEHSVPIDPAVLGRWQEIQQAGEAARNEMLVLKYSDTEYLVHYPTGGEGMYFRAYRVSVEGLAGVQIQVLGTAKGPVDQKDRFDLLAYRLDHGILEIKTLNDDLVEKGIKTAAELRSRVVKHKGDPALFQNSVRFRRLTGEG